MRIYTTRLKPGQEIISELLEIIKNENIPAGFIITAVGGFSHIKCRMAGATPDKQDIREYDGKFELVSMVGTLSKDGVHIHVSFSDETGKVIGGHLKSGVVYPTLEIVIGIDNDSSYNRKLDEDTGFKELVVGQ